MPEGSASPERAIHDALCRHDAAEVRRLLLDHPELRQRINDPIFSFNSPAIVAFAGDPAMVEVLLEAGADPSLANDEGKLPADLAGEQTRDLFA